MQQLFLDFFRKGDGFDPQILFQPGDLGRERSPGVFDLGLGRLTRFRDQPAFLPQRLELDPIARFLSFQAGRLEAGLDRLQPAGRLVQV